MLTTGMAFIVAAVVVALWFLLRGALESTLALDIGAGVVFALLIAVSFIVLLRPPVVLTLDPVGYRTRKDEGKWKDVQDVALADGMLTFADSAERTVSLPLNVIDVSRHTELVNEVYGRLNEAHGYRRFNPADFEQAD